MAFARLEVEEVEALYARKTLIFQKPAVWSEIRHEARHQHNAQLGEIGGRRKGVCRGWLSI
ncbi:MAG: hypothetical protein EBT84_07085 [Sphingomonadaceae bacterium]|nr:hypothetical protein [Sphingomonadaceae bacterium]